MTHRQIPEEMQRMNVTYFFDYPLWYDIAITHLTTTLFSNKNVSLNIHCQCSCKSNPLGWKMKFNTLHHPVSKPTVFSLLGSHFSIFLLCFFVCLLDSALFLLMILSSTSDYNSACCPAFQLSFLKCQSDTSPSPQTTNPSKYPVTGNSLQKNQLLYKGQFPLRTSCE